MERLTQEWNRIHQFVLDHKDADQSLWRGLRAAKYMEILFSLACDVQMYLADEQAEEYVVEENIETAAFLGLYHEIEPGGLPEEMQAGYQEVMESLTESQKVLFQKGKEGFQKPQEENQDNVAGMLLWCAREWDGQVMGFRTEYPLGRANEAMLERIKDEELLMVYKYAYPELKKLFSQFKEQSHRIVTEAPLIKRRKTRPMGLVFRRIKPEEGGTCALYARARITGTKQSEFKEEDVKKIIRQGKIAAELSRYFLYEAADTFRRTINCRIPLQVMMLEMMPQCLGHARLVKQLQQHLEDRDLTAAYLLLVVREQLTKKPTATFLKNMEQLAEEGIGVALKDEGLKACTIEQLENWQIKDVILTEASVQTRTREELETFLRERKERGIRIAADTSLKQEHPWIDAYLFAEIEAQEYLEEEFIKLELSDEW